MKDINLDNDISVLEINSNVVSFLHEHEINKVDDLWRLRRKDLKAIGLKDGEINVIIIKLQLYGIDINKKIYNRD